MKDSDDRFAFSRSGRSNPFGKLDRDVGKLKLSEPTFLALSKFAHDADMPLLEFIREFLDIRAHGLDMYKTIQEERFSLIAGIGKEKG
jgi:hypothetical protein